MTSRWDDRFVREALRLPGEGNHQFATIATDTRALGPEALFVALRGERFDGHDFLVQARDAGATAAVVLLGTARVPGLTFYEVIDTLVAWGDLARAHRRRITGPVIAITGQNGKTSTKEMVAAVLSTRWRTYRTRANNNNLVGVPLTILESPADTEALVIEAGANVPGEIARYREIIEPDIALVTNAGSGHLEGFGSVAGVVKEKLSLTRNVPLAIVGVVPPELADGARARGAKRVITAGLGDAEVHPDQVTLEPDGRARVRIDGSEFVTAARGAHQAGNAMFAWAVARELGIAPVEAAKALEQYTLPSGRGELTQHGRLTVLNDAYNANPESFRALIALVRTMAHGRRLVFVAGTMRELGEAGGSLHSQIAAELASLRPDVLALVGDFVPAFAPFRSGFPGTVIGAPDAESLGPRLALELRGDELVVLKGSRGTTLERILPAILPRAQA
jgi:UDP-N-acetylmuramoyl-tripeptide--D-alanyl-D-alanine ligase